MACVFVNPQGERAHLGLVSVDPALQGRALGSRPMAAVEAQYRTAGNMRWSCGSSTTELARFYQRMGYAETGVTEEPPDQTRVKVPFPLCRCASGWHETGKADWCQPPYFRVCVRTLPRSCRIRLGRNLYETDRAYFFFSARGWPPDRIRLTHRYRKSSRRAESFVCI